MGGKAEKRAESQRRYVKRLMDNGDVCTNIHMLRNSHKTPFISDLPPELVFTTPHQRKPHIIIRKYFHDFKRTVVYLGIGANPSSCSRYLAAGGGNILTSTSVDINDAGTENTDSGVASR
jgi:hypothetical protein